MRRESASGATTGAAGTKLEYAMLAVESFLSVYIYTAASWKHEFSRSLSEDQNLRHTEFRSQGY